MSETVIGLFTDSKRAGEAVSDFIDLGISQDITVIAKDEMNGEVTTHKVQSDVSDGAAAGAATGAVIGGLTALLVGAASFTLPGVGLVVLGPLASVLTGIGAGALTGGVVGALIDWGVPEESAKMYEERLQAGDVLVGVSTDRVSVDDARAIFDRYGATSTQTFYNE